MNVIRDILYLDLTNDLDQYYVEKIREDVDRVLKEKRVRYLIMDFNHVSFMDSSGIGFIMGRYKFIKMYDGAIYVINIGPAVERIFDISGLYRITKKAGGVDDALEAIEGGKQGE